MSDERARVDQYAAVTTESLARMAVEQASRAQDAAEFATVSGTLRHGLEEELRADDRGAFESLVRCVDELARRALEAAACTCVAIAADGLGGAERCERHGQRAVEGERRL